MKVYTKRYEKFRGVDFSTDPALIDDSRSPYCQNLISDNGGYPEKRPGWETLETYGDRINGIHRLVDAGNAEYILVHHGQTLTLTGETPTNVFAAMNDARSLSLVYDNKLYILDGKNYLVFDGSACAPVADAAGTFIPTTTIGSLPSGGGTTFEAVNCLNKWRKNSFVGDGTTHAFVLDAALDAGSTITAYVDGTQTTAFTASGHTVTFTDAPADGAGVDNVVITFAHTTAGYADMIQKCRFYCWFGLGENTRLFFSGNPEYRNWDFMSGLYDPTYFPDNGYQKFGSGASAVMGYLRQYDNILIIKEYNDQDSTIYVRTAESVTAAAGNAETTSVIYPVQQGVAGVGAASMYAFDTLRDDPLFLSREGVYAPTLAYGGAGEQRTLQNRSILVDAKLTKEEDAATGLSNLDTAVSVVWNGYYILCVNSVCYVADSRQMTGGSRTEGKGYEWYYWTNIPARCFAQIEGELYFGTEDGAFCKFRSAESTGARYNDDEDPIDAFWATKQDDDGDFMLLKTMERLGSGVLVKPFSRSSVEISVRTEGLDTTVLNSKGFDIFDFGYLDFSRFTFLTADAPDVLPFGSAVRKYRSLQIIARNNEANEGFGVYGFVKRYHAVKYVK